MTNASVKLTIAGAVLAVAIGYLVYDAVMAGRSWYLSVDSYMTSQEYRGERVQLHGKVAGEGLSIGSEGVNVRFVVLGDTSRITVRYEGVIPNLLKVGGEVVVKGRMGKDDVFEATELMTKCASKYDEMKSEGKKRP